MSVARLCEAAQCQASHPATEDAKEREPNPCREIAIVEEAFGKIWQLPNRGRRKRRVAKHCTCQARRLGEASNRMRETRA